MGDTCKIILGAINFTVGCITRANPDTLKYIVAGGIGRFIQQVINANKLFPVGNSTGKYFPVTLRNNGTLDDYGVRFVNATAACLDPTHSLNITLDIVEETAGGSYVGIIFDYKVEILVFYLVDN